MTFTLTLPILPLLLIIFFVMAAASFILRAWSQWVALAGAIVAALLGFGIWQVDLSRPMWVLPNGWSIDFAAPLTRYGYTLQLQQDNIPIVALSLLIAACALLLASNGLRDSSFPGVTWLLVGGYVFVAIITAGPRAPVILVPLALAMLSAIAVFAVQNTAFAEPAAALRSLTRSPSNGHQQPHAARCR